MGNTAFWGSFDINTCLKRKITPLGISLESLSPRTFLDVVNFYNNFRRKQYFNSWINWVQSALSNTKIIMEGYMW